MHRFISTNEVLFTLQHIINYIGCEMSSHKSELHFSCSLGQCLGWCTPGQSWQHLLQMGCELCSLCARVIAGAKLTVPWQPGAPGSFHPAEVWERSRLESLLHSRLWWLRTGTGHRWGTPGHLWALMGFINCDLHCSAQCHLTGSWGQILAHQFERMHQIFCVLVVMYLLNWIHYAMKCYWTV